MEIKPTKWIWSYPSSLYYIMLLKDPTLYLRRTNFLMLLTVDICYECPLPFLTAWLLTQKKGLCFPCRHESFLFLPSSPLPPQLLCIISVYNMLWGLSGRKDPCSITTFSSKANTEKNDLLVIKKLFAYLSYAIYALHLIQNCKMQWFVLYHWALLPGIPSQYRHL